jgi:hypothetical protein
MSSLTGFENPATESSPPAATNIYDVASCPIETMDPTCTLDPQDAIQTTLIVPVESTDIVAGKTTSDVVMGDTVESTDIMAGETTSDVVMGDTTALDTPAQKPQNNKNLPPWLAGMIKYLCKVAEDMLWQNLVTEFVEFKKGGPPNGIWLPCSLSPNPSLSLSSNPPFAAIVAVVDVRDVAVACYGFCGQRMGGW